MTMRATGETVTQVSALKLWPVAATIVFATAAALFVAVPVSFAEDLIKVQANATTRVFVMAGFNPDCTFKSFPEIQLTAAPTKGQVSFKPGEKTTVKYSSSGDCVGKSVEGTGIYYTPAPGQAGEDRFAVRVLLDKAEPVTRTFSVVIVDKVRTRRAE
jgi:hypothetical protein